MQDGLATGIDHAWQEPRSCEQRKHTETRVLSFHVPAGSALQLFCSDGKPLSQKGHGSKSTTAWPAQQHPTTS